MMIIKERITEYAYNGASGVSLTSPKAVVETLTRDYDLDAGQEQLIVLGLANNNKSLLRFVIAKGGYNSVMATPASIFRKLITSGCSKFVLAHNHPSGTSQPSKEDIQFTKKIVDASKLLGIDLLDHIVYTYGNGYASMREMGIL